MKKNHLIIGFIAAVLLSFISCSDFPGYKKTDTGLYYKFFVQNEDSLKPQLGDIMTVDMIYKIQKTDSLIFDSRKMDQLSKLMLLKPMYNGDISEGLAMMASGDSASFIINADSFFIKNVGLQKLPDFIKPETKLTFYVKIRSIQKKADYEKEQKLKMEKLKAFVEERKAKEPEELKAYLKENKITAKPTTSGLYYIETKKGTGVKLKNGQTVKIHYTGKLLDGTVFGTSKGKEPLSFVLGNKEVIEGWEEGLLLMKIGGQATLIIPSSLAYGADGRGQVIMPYTTLTFDVEVIDAK
jgi:FKBP-type peptidyl-prolyl cis-trans isomerase FkpA